MAEPWIMAAGVFVVLQQINPPFSLCSEPELGLKSVWLFVFIALTNLFI